MHYVGVTFILRNRFEITKHDRGQSGRSGTSSRKLGIQPNSTLNTIAEVVKVDRTSPATNSRARKPPGRFDRTGSMHRRPHRRSHRGALLSVPKKHAPDLGRAVLPRARRIASQRQRSQIKRREPTESLCSFAAVHPRPSPCFFLEGTTVAASHRNESVMRRIPRDRRASCTPRPLPRVALRRCARPANSARPRAPPRSRTRSSSISFAPPSAESRRTAACSPRDTQRPARSRVRVRVCVCVCVMIAGLERVLVYVVGTTSRCTADANRAHSGFGRERI